MSREPFNFAGFAWPRRAAMFKQYDRMFRHPRRPGKSPWTFAYTVAPRPLPRDGFAFYLDSDFAPGLRWQWCDEVEGVRIGHEGWHSDPHGDGNIIRGLVLRLPHGRGFLAGWSMGAGMATEVARTIYATEHKAAYAADREAERVAEGERERAEGFQAGSEAREELREAMAAALANVQESRIRREHARRELRLALAMRGAAEVPPEVIESARRGYRDFLSESRRSLAEALDSRQEAWESVRKARPCKYREQGDFADGFAEGFAE